MLVNRLAALPPFFPCLSAPLARKRRLFAVLLIDRAHLSAVKRRRHSPESGVCLTEPLSTKTIQTHAQKERPMTADELFQKLASLLPTS